MPITAKPEKLCKNPLTIEGWGAIICKLSRTAAVGDSGPGAAHTNGANQPTYGCTEPRHNPERKSRKKLKKLLKNLLTNEKRCDIIRRSLCEGNNFQRAQESHEKSFWKTFQKPLDKRKELWYNSRALPLRSRNGSKRTAKNFEKTFQKPLDKQKRMWYNKRVAQNAAAS